MEYRRRSFSGEWIWINSIGKVTEWGKNNEPLRMTGIHTNVTIRRNMEDALREQEEFFRLIAENGEDFIAVLDLEGRRRYNNPAYGKLFGDIEAIKGTDSFADIHPEDRDRIKQMFMDTVNSGIGHRAEFRFVLANGEIRHMESCGGLIKNGRGKASCVVVVAHDITEHIRAEEEIRNLAFHDTLTSLPNRRLLEDRLGQALANSNRSGFFGALLFLDLDNFKPLNDTHGHPVGDLLLIEVANRLKSCVRETDTVARFGGDEFAVILNELDADKTESTSQAEIIAEKIRIALSEPYLLTIKQEGMAVSIVEHHCTASIGLTLFINHEASQADILSWADTAMYQAKESGRNLIRIYESSV
jgi:diguanylate cyclase (GGDEF)-like protein/PAS domain S-box-containing protein